MANSNQTFSVAGITILNGNAKVRFANDMVRRIKILTKTGATRVDFVELPSAMTKIEALKYLATLPEFANASDQATISDTLEDKSKEASKGEVKVKASKTKPSIDAIKSRAKKVEVSAEDILSAVSE
jgi:hypothetical protein